MSFQRKMQRNIWKHIGNKKGKRFFNRFPLIYANNEPKSALARDLGDCRDNKGKLAKRVFTCLQEIPMELSVKKWTQVIRKIHI